MFCGETSSKVVVF